MPHLQLLLIGAHRPLIDLLAKNIHTRTLEFPRADTPFKQQVQLRKTAAHRLRHAEIRVYDTAEADGCPEKARVVTPVPFTGVQHIRCENRADDTDDVIEVTAENDGLDLQATCRQFGNKRVADCADGELVEEGPD